MTAEAMLRLAGDNPWLIMVSIYFITILVTEVVTNNAAVALMFPIGLSAAESLGVSPMPFIMCIMMAGSAAFSTPIGYQTNLMVYGPGGYKFTDFTRFGLPLNFIAGAVAICVAPLVWPF